MVRAADTVAGIAESVVAVDTVVVAAVALASLAVSGSYHKTLPQRLPERHTGDTDTTAAFMASKNSFQCAFIAPSIIQMSHCPEKVSEITWLPTVKLRSKALSIRLEQVKYCILDTSSLRIPTPSSLLTDTGSSASIFTNGIVMVVRVPEKITRCVVKVKIPVSMVFNSSCDSLLAEAPPNRKLKPFAILIEGPPYRAFVFRIERDSIRLN